MTPQFDTDVCILGAGLSGCSLALALLDRGFKGRIALYEQNPSVNANKTWCFWNEALLPDYLRKLIHKRWSSWNVSRNNDLAYHRTSEAGLQYCCIRATDFYDFALSTLSEADNVDIFFNAFAEPLNSNSSSVKASVGGDVISAQWGFDSRNSQSALGENGVYQCFTGAWVRSQKPVFDDNNAQLMSEMSTSSNGLEFTYVLPFDSHNALVELTRFSNQSESLNDLKVSTEQRLSNTFADEISIENWEAGVLPMTVDSSSPPVGHWHKIGINGGHIRASTGYAFLSVQRFSQSAAKSILDKRKISMQPFSTYYLWLDKIFLRVIKRNPQLTPELFLRMVNRTKPEQFARFMSESATLKDVLSVVLAMPKQPFIRALW